ncbi:MAG: hypothetical protein ACF8XB_20965, partial [Planctomycetota bacterium JB042]
MSLWRVPEGKILHGIGSPITGRFISLPDEVENAAEDLGYEVSAGMLNYWIAVPGNRARWGQTKAMLSMLAHACRQEGKVLNLGLHAFEQKPAQPGF